MFRSLWAVAVYKLAHYLECRILLTTARFMGRLLRLQRGSEGEEDQTVYKYILHCGCLVFQMIRSSAAFQGVSVCKLKLKGLTIRMLYRSMNDCVFTWD